MQYDIATTGDHVSLQIKRPDLPDDEQQREAILDDLETAVKTVLAEHGLNDDGLRTVDGHTYASIKTNCPLCSDRLQLIEPSLGPNNGAFATALCECGWSGDAIYRLIDLHERHSRPADDCADSGSGDPDTESDESSSVRLYDLQPRYLPY